MPNVPPMHRLITAFEEGIIFIIQVSQRKLVEWLQFPQPGIGPSLDFLRRSDSQGLTFAVHDPHIAQTRMASAPRGLHSPLFSQRLAQEGRQPESVRCLSRRMLNSWPTVFHLSQSSGGTHTRLGLCGSREGPTHPAHSSSNPGRPHPAPPLPPQGPAHSRPAPPPLRAPPRSGPQLYGESGRSEPRRRLRWPLPRALVAVHGCALPVLPHGGAGHELVHARLRVGAKACAGTRAGVAVGTGVPANF